MSTVQHVEGDAMSRRSKHRRNLNLTKLEDVDELRDHLERTDGAGAAGVDSDGSPFLASGDLLVPLVRMITDNGVRHDLSDVAEEFGVNLTECPAGRAGLAWPVFVLGMDA